MQMASRRWTGVAGGQRHLAWTRFQAGSGIIFPGGFLSGAICACRPGR